MKSSRIEAIAVGRRLERWPKLAASSLSSLTIIAKPSFERMNMSDLQAVTKPKICGAEAQSPS